MSDSIAGAAAWLGGIEIVNDSRTSAYMKNGIKPGTLQINGDCGCENILELAGCDTGYSTPAEDNAPWYDASIPESAEFAGFLSTEFEGLASTYTRSVTESIADGATLGRSRFGSRTMTWKGFLFGSSCCGVAYGLRWLGKTLQGSQSCGNNCFGEDLELLVCCPTIEAASGYGPNLICNPDFDFGIDDWIATGDTDLTWINDPVYTLPGAMRIVNPIGGAMTFTTGGASGAAGNCQIQVVAGKTYILSFRLKFADGPNLEDISLNFNWLNSFGNPLSTTVASGFGFSDEPDWLFVDTTVTAPVGAFYLSIDFTIGDGATLPSQVFYFDNVKLNQFNYATPVEAFRTIKGVSLLEGPVVTNQRKMGSACGGRCGGSTALEVEFSLIGSQPWLYSAPIPVVNCVPAEENSVPIIGATLAGILNSAITDLDTTLSSVDFAFLPTMAFPENIYIILDPYSEFGSPEIVKVNTHAASATTITVFRQQQGTDDRSHPFGTFWLVQTDCSPDDCGADISIPNCSGPELPPTATYVGCVTNDVNSWRALYITAPRTMWNSLSQVVPVITIQNGPIPIIGARIGFYTSADGNPCGDLINNPPACDLICDVLYISVLPPNSKFYIDGRTRKMSLICGTNAVFPGERYTSGPFSWPIFDCYGFCMEFAYDPTHMSGDTCVSLSLVPRTTL